MKRYLKRLWSLAGEIEDWQHRNSEKLKGHGVLIDSVKKRLIELHDELTRKEEDGIL